MGTSFLPAASGTGPRVSSGLAAGLAEVYATWLGVGFAPGETAGTGSLSHIGESMGAMRVCVCVCVCVCVYVPQMPLQASGTSETHLP